MFFITCQMSCTWRAGCEKFMSVLFLQVENILVRDMFAAQDEQTTKFVALLALFDALLLVRSEGSSKSNCA